MKRTFYILFVFLAMYFTNTNAQGGAATLSQFNGVPVRESAYTAVEGNPFLINDWVDGSVTFKDNQKTDATLKYDIYNNTLLFKDKDGATMELKNHITSFTLNSISDISNVRPLIFVNGLPITGMQTEKSWYQLIGDGRVKLLKYYKKTINEHREFTSATTTRKFNTFQYYYVFTNNRMTAFSPGKKAVQKLFEDHAAQLEAWLKANRINYKSDADLLLLFMWYNSLR